VTDQPQHGAGNLWLAEELWTLGGVEFGDFTLGRTAVHSPIHINVRRLISNPSALQRIATIMRDELKARLTRRHPQMRSFEIVAGVPMGGLHLATSFSLATQMPMIYRHPMPPLRNGDEETIEGIYRPGQTALIIDDLITGGGSIQETAEALRDAGLHVHDAVVLVDRQEGGAETLRELGINLIHVLTLEQIANYLMSAGHIGEPEYRRTMEYIDGHRRRP
jgi:orotate phosphoribosyltransferase/uridine monophosphate synthetase